MEVGKLYDLSLYEPPIIVFINYSMFLDRKTLEVASGEAYLPCHVHLPPPRPSPHPQPPGPSHYVGLYMYAYMKENSNGQTNAK